MTDQGATQTGPGAGLASAHIGRVERFVAFVRTDLGYGRTALVWSLFQSVFLPLPVELWVGVVALFGRYGGLRAVLWAIVGATLGGLLVALLPGAALGLMVSLPGVDPALLEAADRSLASDGWWAFVVGPWQGLPYRVLAAVSGFREMPTVGVLFITPIARGASLLPVAVGVAALRTVWRERIDRMPAVALAIYVVVVALVFLVWNAVWS